MTQAEVISIINKWILNSAVDAFTNLRLHTVVMSIATSGITGQYATYDDFKAAIAAGKTAGTDNFMRVLVATSQYGDNRIFEYFPGVNLIMWTASQPIEQL